MAPASFLLTSFNEDPITPVDLVCVAKLKFKQRRGRRLNWSPLVSTCDEGRARLLYWIPDSKSLCASVLFLPLLG